MTLQRDGRDSARGCGFSPPSLSLLAESWGVSHPALELHETLSPSALNELWLTLRLSNNSQFLSDCRPAKDCFVQTSNIKTVILSPCRHKISHCMELIMELNVFAVKTHWYAGVCLCPQDLMWFTYTFSCCKINQSVCFISQRQYSLIQHDLVALQGFTHKWMTLKQHEKTFTMRSDFIHHDINI